MRRQKAARISSGVGFLKEKKLKTSGWLDEKEKEKADVSQIVLPKNMPYDEDPIELYFSKEFILAGCSVRKIIPLPPTTPGPRKMRIR